MTTLPNEEVMRLMAKIAMEQATTFFADMALQFAPISANLNGKDALTAFAEAIRKTNADMYPKGPRA